MGREKGEDLQQSSRDFSTGNLGLVPGARCCVSQHKTWNTQQNLITILDSRRASTDGNLAVLGKVVICISLASRKEDF